jgi:pantoate--beta-alanine ligase
MAPHEVAPEYLALVDPDSFLRVDAVNGRVLVAVAARVGDTRLIDNALVATSPAEASTPNKER